MNSYKHLMVSLDLSEIDDHLMNYAKFLADKLGTEKITFMHVVKDWDLPDEIEALIDVPGGGDLDTLLTNEIEERAEEKFKDTQLEIEVELRHDKAIVSAIEKEITNGRPDLLLVGNKNTYMGSGYASTKIMEHLDIPILLIPETAYLSVNNILLPIDFSKPSMDVARTGHDLAGQLGANKQALHVLHLPKVFFPYIPEKAAIEEARKNANKELESFKKKLRLGEDFTCKIVPSGEYGISRTIYKYAIKHQYDLIIIGAKGKTMLNVAKIGGIAYRLAELDMHVPLLVLK